MTTDYFIPEPCHESWDGMSPTEQGRHCAVCNKVVLDLTRTPAARAQATLAAALDRGDKVCARVVVDSRKRARFARLHRHVLTNGLALLLGAGAMAAEPSPVPGDGAAHPAPIVQPVKPDAEIPVIMGELVVTGDLCEVPKPDDKPVAADPDDKPESADDEQDVVRDDAAASEQLRSDVIPALDNVPEPWISDRQPPSADDEPSLNGPDLQKPLKMGKIIAVRQQPERPDISAVPDEDAQGSRPSINRLPVGVRPRPTEEQSAETPQSGAGDF